MESDVPCGRPQVDMQQELSTDDLRTRLFCLAEDGALVDGDGVIYELPRGTWLVAVQAGYQVDDEAQRYMYQAVQTLNRVWATRPRRSKVVEVFDIRTARARRDDDKVPF